MDIAIIIQYKGKHTIQHLKCVFNTIPLVQMQNDFTIGPRRRRHPHHGIQFAKIIDLAIAYHRHVVVNERLVRCFI